VVEVKKYSSRHLELKFILPFAKKKVLKKDISYYIFTPEQLNVNATTTSLESMSHKFRTHGRYASPELSLEELIDKTNDLSPLTKLTKYVDTLKLGKDLEVSDVEFTHEAQAVVNSLRHQLQSFQTKCFCLIRSKNLDEFKAIVKDWKKKRQILEQKFIFLIDDLLDLELENKMFVTALYWADEASGLISEQYASEILSLCESTEELESVNSFLKKIVYHEIRRRKKMGYASNVDIENLSFRRETLRKWSKSVLRLDPVISKTPKRVNEIVAGVAASLAMSFALVATLFAQAKFSGQTIRWGLLVVIIYVFKDRIKDGIKRIFTKIQPKLIADEIFTYKSPRTGVKVCSSKNNLLYFKESKVPKAVRAVRRKNSSNLFYKMLREESVVQFSHYLKIYPLNKNHDVDKKPWMTSFALVDHVRMDDWFKEMIDRYVDVDNINEPNNSVYHIHLVIEDKISKKKSNFYHYLVVIDFSGILYVKELTDQSIPTRYEISQQLERQRIKREKKIVKKEKKLLKEKPNNK
jgi:hypothetical protein